MIPSFETKDDLFKWLHTNKNLVMSQKKSTMKLADAVIVVGIGEGASTISKMVEDITDANQIKVVSIINTTKLYDSHGDVHIDGLWNKSLSVPNKMNFLVKEHKFNFDGIISDVVKSSTENYTWKELGYNYEGKTQALVYTSIIDKDDPTGMFGKYAAGKVKQHSVGMQYVKMALAIDQKKYAEEKSIWDKYFGTIANKEDAENAGYFWAITEAKDIEGSAVVKGSNFVTPTQSVSAKQVQSTQREQVQSIPKINIDEALKKFTIKI